MVLSSCYSTNELIVYVVEVRLQNETIPAVRQLFAEGKLDEDRLHCELTLEAEAFRMRATEICLVEGVLQFDEPTDVKNMADKLLAWTYLDWDLAAGVERAAGREILSDRRAWMKDMRDEFTGRGEQYAQAHSAASETEPNEAGAEGEPLVAPGEVSKNVQKVYKNMVLEAGLSKLSRRVLRLDKECAEVDGRSRVVTSPAILPIVHTRLSLTHTSLGSEQIPMPSGPLPHGDGLSTFERLHEQVWI